ncbi:hypothetical protein ACLOJK_014251 [Asimina triloba]
MCSGLGSWLRVEPNPIYNPNLGNLYEAHEKGTTRQVGLPELRSLQRTFIKLTGQASLSGPPPPSDADSAKRILVALFFLVGGHGTPENLIGTQSLVMILVGIGVSTNFARDAKQKQMGERTQLGWMCNSKTEAGCWRNPKEQQKLGGKTQDVSYSCLICQLGRSLVRFLIVVMQCRKSERTQVDKPDVDLSFSKGQKCED